MKKSYFILVWLCCLAGTLTAAPVLPRAIRAAQPDGTMLTLYPYGDEYGYYFETVDGYRVVKEGERYCYFSADGPQITAHNPDNRDREELLFLETYQSPSSVTLRFGERITRSPIGAVSIHTGSPAIPVILVQFKDKRMQESDPKAGFSERLCRPATRSEIEQRKGSAFQYFVDQSDGAYTPNFVVIGPVTLDKNEASYGADGSAIDSNVGTMIYDAIIKAVESGDVSDWSKFDNDKDGVVDVVYVIYAGEGQHSLPMESDLVWPHSSSLAERGITSPKVGDLIFNAYSCSNELLNGVPDGFGTFCHEFSHQLGLPDFYRTDGVAVDEFAMGSWSLMDFGSYAEGGFLPVGYRALEKYHMGWLDMTELTEPTSVVGWKSTSAGASGLKVVNTVSASEYYLLEVIDGKGWDFSCKGRGLLVTHIYLSGMDAWNNNTVNNTNPPRVAVIPADNARTALITGVNEAEYETGLAGDTYPSPDGNDELTDSSMPAASVQVGLTRKMGKPITSITYDEASGTVSFDFMGGSEDNVLSSVHILQNDNLRYRQYFRLDGTPVEAPLHGVYIYRNSDGTTGKILKP